MIASRRLILAGAPAVALGACSQVTAALNSATPAVASAQSAITVALADAQTFWGVIKGLALVASLADPALAASITSAVAAIDALVATAPQIQADVTAATALAAQIVSQAVQLTNKVAPAIKVVAG